MDLHHTGFRLRLLLSACLIAAFLAPLGSVTFAASPPKMLKAATNEFDAVSAAVVTLLKGGDAKEFAEELTPSSADWKAMASTNVPESAENLKGFIGRREYDRSQLEASAKELLAKAASLHLDFSKGDLHAEVIPPGYLGSMHYPTLQADGEQSPFAAKLEIVLRPDAYATNQAAGDFKIGLHRLEKYAGGWRLMGGIQWASFPANIADEKTLREMAILDKAAAYKGITGNDDPALTRLGEAVVEFIRTGDTNAYARKALVSSDLVWEQIQKAGRAGPSRKEVDEMVNKRAAEHLKSAQGLLAQMKEAGIDLKDAKIRITETSLGRLQSRGQAASLEGMMGDGFKVKLAVETDQKTRSGVSLAGDYILAIKRVSRYGDDWRATEELRWDEVPPGVFDKDVLAQMKLESYVAEHGSFPPGTAAPEIEFVALDGDKKMKLSDLRGKVVVLDFWATWCGPCQQPMAELQKLRDSHSAWGDQVAIVPLSIDDTEDVLRKHLAKHGWTNTFNVWAGDGGWASSPAKTFRVTGVPTTYIIDPQGKVAVAGHPASMPIGERVDALLKQAKE